jgi:hypothetical protein
MKKYLYLYGFIAFIFPITLYVQTISFEFTNFDDNKIITDNIAFLSDIDNYHKVFYTDAFVIGSSQFYRPLQILSYMTDILISGGNNPWIFHLTNTLLFSLIIPLVFLFLTISGIESKYALLLALIFAAHPIFVPIVAWIPARGDLLLTIFALLSILSLIKYFNSGKVVFLGLHMITYLLALLSKETAAVLPVLFILYLYLIANRPDQIRKPLFLISMYAVTALIWYLIRADVLDEKSGNSLIQAKDEIIGFTPFLQNLRTIPEALSKFLFPFKLAPIPSFSILRTLSGCTFIVIFGILLFRIKFKVKGSKIFYLSWFLLLMLPPMFFKHKLIDYLDHRFFLPLIGILLFISTLIFKSKTVTTHKVFTKSILWIMITVIISFGSISFIKSGTYKDPLTFYKNATERNPRSAIAHNNLGALYHNIGKYDRAIGEYNLAIGLNNRYINALNNRANAYFKRNQYDNAIHDYTAVIRMDPRDAGSYNNRGVAYIRIGMIREACHDFTMAKGLGSSSAGKNLELFCGRNK